VGFNSSAVTKFALLGIASAPKYLRVAYQSKLNKSFSGGNGDTLWSGGLIKNSDVEDLDLIEAVKCCDSVSAVLRFLGKRVAGGSHKHYAKRIKDLSLDTSHFKRYSHQKGSSFPIKKTADDILVLRESGGRQKSHQLKRGLLERGREYICEICGVGETWMQNPLVLDIDHINQNWLDDREENLRFLCPNCHSQFTRKLLDS